MRVEFSESELAGVVECQLDEAEVDVAIQDRQAAREEVCQQLTNERLQAPLACGYAGLRRLEGC